MAGDAAIAPRVGKALTFAREHPALSILGVAGAGLVGGLELAAGVIIGAGISAILKRNGHAAAARTAATAGATTGATTGAEAEAEGATSPSLDAAAEAATKVAAKVATGSHVVRDRARRLLERTPREAKKRARAVVQAARGKIPPSEGAREAQERETVSSAPVDATVV